MRKPYPTDLSDAEWNYIQPHPPAPKGHGRPRTHSLREILKHPRQVSLPQTYAQPMLKAGELCVPHSKSGERAARAHLRFRRDPDAYLRRLEEQLLKRALPS